MIKRVYIAGPWTERPFVRSVREKVKAVGIDSTSRWLDFPGDSHDPKVLETEAKNDYTDLWTADALFLLNLQKRGEETSGKAVETGLAIAWGKPIFMVGDPSNVFHYLPEVKRFDHVEGAIEAMRTWEN